MSPRAGRPRRTSPTVVSGDVRARAAAVAEQVVTTMRPAQRALENGGRGLTEVDRKLLLELVLGTIRWLRRLDWVISAVSGRPIERIDDPIRWPLRVAAYQLLFLDRMPGYAVVDEAVAEVKRRRGGRAAGFANAVLRRLAEKRSLAAWEPTGMDELQRVGIKTSHPDFLLTRWREQFGWEATLSLLDANNTVKPMHLLCLRERRSTAQSLAKEGVETSTEVISPRGLKVVSGDLLGTSVFSRGEVYIQDDASQAAALVPPPRPGEKVLDLAAAPGGKGFTLAAAEASTRITSADVSMPRLLTLRENRRRLGVRSWLALVDGRRPAFGAVFDRVVVDLPCSGTGTIARHPELKWRLSLDEIERLASQGQELLEASSSLVVPGGLLCAITCSLEAEENEFLMRRFLERERPFERVRLEPLLPPPLAIGDLGEGLWRLLTSGEHDGFTVQVLKRVASD